MRADLIEVYKIVHGHSPIAFDDFFEFDNSGRTKRSFFQVTKAAMSTGFAAALLLGKDYNFVE